MFEALKKLKYGARVFLSRKGGEAETIGLGEVILGGVSLGGWIAAEFAVRWPERVKKLWLAAAPGLWVDDEPMPDLFRNMAEPVRLRRLLFHDPEGYVAKMIISDDADE